MSNFATVLATETCKGSDIASAAALSVPATQSRFDVTGTTGITTIQTNGRGNGTLIRLRFTGVLTITHHASNLILTDGASITTTAGQMLEFEVIGTNQVRQVALGGVTAAQLSLKAPLASPALTGTPTAPTAPEGTDNTQIATTAFVVASAPKVPGTSLSTSSDTLPTALAGAGAVYDSGYLYVVGGHDGTSYLSTLRRLEVSSGTWTTLTAMPAARAFMGACISSGVIYVAGGDNGGTAQSTLYAYTISTDTWTTKAALPGARMYTNLAAYSGKLYSAGGYDSTRQNALYEYTISTDTWATKTAMSTSLHGAATAAVGGKLYVSGGNDGAALNTLYEYTISTDTWATKATMPGSSEAILTLFAYNNVIYRFGGWNGSATNDVYAYSIASDAWTTLADLPSAKNWISVASNGATAYLAGGSTTDSIYIFTVGSVGAARAGNYVATAPGGSVMGKLSVYDSTGAFLGTIPVYPS